MKDIIEFGIGFVTGRSNVCKLINSYYKFILNQVENLDKKVNFTFFILYDMNYQFEKRTDFYSIIPDVYKNIKIKYITPEDIEEEKKILISRKNIKKEDIDLIFGHGHAKGRNTVMYFALKRNIDYLLFWDDDEYPYSCSLDENKDIIWKKQNNILEHIKYIEDSDVTIGYHCGYISPIPYIDGGDKTKEQSIKQYIEAISNDIINWDNIKERFEKDNGVTYVEENNETYEIKYDGVGKWIAGSTLCINLNNIDKIPAFYNPEGARGEDTFFSTGLKDTKVLRVPVYHFHDGFLKYTQIMKNKFPKKLRKISMEEDSIEHRFLQASLGWIKYKPLYLYLSDKENYKENIKTVRKNLESSIPNINILFKNHNLREVLYSFEKSSKNVEEDYNEYLKTNKVWDEVKKIVRI